MTEKQTSISQDLYDLAETAGIEAIEAYRQMLWERATKGIAMMHTEKAAPILIEWTTFLLGTRESKP